MEIQARSSRGSFRLEIRFERPQIVLSHSPSGLLTAEAPGALQGRGSEPWGMREGEWVTVQLAEVPEELDRKIC